MYRFNDTWSEHIVENLKYGYNIVYSRAQKCVYHVYPRIGDITRPEILSGTDLPCVNYPLLLFRWSTKNNKYLDNDDYTLRKYISIIIIL